MKLSSVWLCAAFAVAALVLPCSSQQEYEWFPSNTGGGGYITGITSDPANPEIIYARCDVGGVFRTTDGGKTWVPSNGGLKRWYNHSVQSLAIHPTNSKIILRCSGDSRNNKMFGSIHKSVDGGVTWKEVTNGPSFYGNGPTRMYGELVAFDPSDPRTVIAAGYSGGIWVSRDVGETWIYSTAKGEQFLTLAIRPGKKGSYYAATADGKLYASSDRGKTWSILHRFPGKTALTELAFRRDKPAFIYAAATDGVYRSEDAGKSFVKAMKGLPENFQYNTIAIADKNPDVLFTAADARPNHKLAPIPVYRSTDGGKTWALVKRHTFKDAADYPAYINDVEHIGWAISKVRIQDGVGNRFMFSNWYGVSFTTDGGHTYNGKYFSGLETNCLEHIQVSDANPNRVIYTVADHRPMVSADHGGNYLPLKSAGYPSSTALSRSRQKPDLFIYGGRNKSKAAIIRQDRDSIAVMLPFAEGFVQAIREDETRPGHFYALVEGKIADGAGLYQSFDYGREWSRVNGPYSPSVIELPVNRSFIEDQLLNIVVGQVKNVCGANQLLTTDPLQPSVLYLGEWTDGLWRSDNNGSAWQDISKGLPFHRDTASVLTVIKADPVRKGWVYAGFIREGLWRSKNNGETWEKIYPDGKQVYNVSSLHVGGRTGDEIFIAGENLYWSDAPVSVLYSQDNGDTWKEVYDPKLGALRIKAIDVDRRTGTIYLASSGNGAFYAIRK